MSVRIVLPSAAALVALPGLFCLAPTRAAAEQGAIVPGPARAASPLVQELLAVADEERHRILELRRAIAAASDHARHLALQREVEAVKLATEIRLLRIQADHARRVGRARVADELDAAIARIAGTPGRNANAPSRATSPSDGR
jgi:hypothetical protein